MTVSDLRKQTVEALNNELLALHKEGFNLRTQRSVGQTVPAHLLKKNRRQIARVKTILREREGSSV